MRKSKYRHVKPEEVKEYYLNHTAKETSEHFDFASVSSLEYFLAKNNIMKNKEKSESKVFTRLTEITLTEEQQLLAVEKYKNQAGLQRVAQHFHVTKQEIRNILDKYGVKLKFRKLNDDEYLWARNEYLNNPVSVKEIARELEVDPEVLYDLFGEEGIQRKNKFTYNNDFFRCIDTEDKAYWLGFLYADGYLDVPDNKLVLETKYDDREHLKKLINHLCPQKIYKKKTIEKFGNVYDSAFVYFNSPEIVGDLINIGCTGVKTFTLEFPKGRISPELLRHFIRGYFDGDGSVLPIKDRYGVYVEYCGNEGFLNDLQIYFKSIIEEYTVVKLSPKGKAFTFRKGGNEVSFDLYKYMYKDATVYLDRKYQRFVDSYGELK
ncbi:LAGLIDADG family homing endonuclease [Bacillus pseudomycoides]|uniref:LAGLIDADG family homing endonuclease n=1 Tax=Bacillus pseudomycoides TaxID=64104 RepID=UPI001FB24434|nr:LAGLIDADG family homing endonuclease [Bacillus pseudomycoides]